MQSRGPIRNDRQQELREREREREREETPCYQNDLRVIWFQVFLSNTNNFQTDLERTLRGYILLRFRVELGIMETKRSEKSSGLVMPRTPF